MTTTIEVEGKLFTIQSFVYWGSFGPEEEVTITNYKPTPKNWVEKLLQKFEPKNTLYFFGDLSLTEEEKQEMIYSHCKEMIKEG